MSAGQTGRGRGGGPVFFVLLALYVGLGPVPTVQGHVDDTPWPTFGQNLQRTGQSPNAATTGKWGVNPVATVAVPPAVGPDGHVYFARDDGNGTLALGKYRAADGSLLLEMTSALTGTPDAQPVISGDLVLVSTIDGSGTEVNGYLDIVEGLSDNALRSVFSVPLETTFEEVDEVSTPTLGNDGMAYVMVDRIPPLGGSTTDLLVAVDRDDGSVEWDVSLADSSTVGAPLVRDDGSILATAGNGVLYSVPSDGSTVDTLFDGGAEFDAGEWRLLLSDRRGRLHGNEENGSREVAPRDEKIFTRRFCFM